MEQFLKKVANVFPKIIIIIVIIAIIIFLASATYIVTIIDATNSNHRAWSLWDNSIGNNSNNFNYNMSAQIENRIISQITSSNIISKGNGDYKLDIDLDEQISNIYTKFNESTEGKRILSYLTGTEEEKKELLKNMARAEILTQYPDLRSKERMNSDVDSNEVQGVIQIKRVLSDSIKKVESIEKSSNTSLDLKGLVCWGDEYTLGNDDDSYPTKLAELTQTNVYNLGFKDEKAEEILLRIGANGYIFETTEEFTIGPGFGEEATFTAQMKIEERIVGTIFTNCDGTSEDKILKCTINGIEGELIYTDNKYKFIRKSEGSEEVTISSGTEIKIETQGGYNECIPIIWIGNNNYKFTTNDGELNKIINYYKDLIDTLENPEDYIVIIPLYYTDYNGNELQYESSEYDNIKKKLEDAFSNHCVDLKELGWSKENGNDSLANILKNKIEQLGFDVGEIDEQNPNAGQIVFGSTISAGEEITLEYIPLGNKLEPAPGTLRWLMEQDDDNMKNAALQFFSIDSSGNLIVANWSRVTTTYDNQTDADGGRDSYANDDGYPTVDVVYTLNTVKVNYKNSISQYTMPFDYLWTFVVMGEDTEFVKNITNLALNSKIEATLYDELIVVENDDVDEYTTAYNQHVTYDKTRYEDEYDEISDNYKAIKKGSSKEEYDIDSGEIDTKQRINIVTETNKVKYRLTYADVWCLTYKVDGVEQVHYDGREQESVSIEGGNSGYQTEKKENFTINSQRNTKIYATSIVPVGCENAPLVVLCHGFTGKKEGDDNHFIKIGEKIAQSGIAAIMIDFPGCGKSEEPSTNYTLTNMENDINSAVQYMKETYGIDEDQIGIVGHSMGGRVASEYLDNAGVKVAALLAPANGDGINGLEFLSDSQDTNTLITSSRDRWHFEVSETFINNMRASHPQSKISSFLGSGGKIFVAYGTDDNIISQNTRNAVKTAVGDGNYHEYSGGNHNLDNSGVTGEIVTDVAKFLCESFGKTMSSSSNTEFTDLYQQTIQTFEDENWTTYDTQYPETPNEYFDGGYISIQKTVDYQKRVINHAITTTIIKSGYTYTEGTTSTKEKTDKTVTAEEIQSRTFNDPNFVKYYVYSKTARTTISSIYYWLFEALEINGRTAEMVDITKYMIYKATDENTGITSYDFNSYNETDFKDATEYNPIGASAGSNEGVLGQVELDGSYNVNGVLLSNPIVDPILFVGSYANHGAVDINPTQNGGTPVYAAADGTVVTATYHSSYGNYVLINHTNGVSTLYAHAQSLVVSAGQTVTKGQLIMYEGSTGNSSGPHVHFEIRINGQRNQSLAEDMFKQLGFRITYNY